MSLTHSLQRDLTMPLKRQYLCDLNLHLSVTARLIEAFHLRYNLFKPGQPFVKFLLNFGLRLSQLRVEDSSIRTCVHRQLRQPGIRDQQHFVGSKGEELTENNGRTSIPWYGLKLPSYAFWNETESSSEGFCCDRRRPIAVNLSPLEKQDTISVTKLNVKKRRLTEAATSSPQSPSSSSPAFLR